MENSRSKNRKIFAIVTAIWSLLQIIPGFMNFFAASVIERFRDLGYPQHLRILLGFAEIFGVLAIAIPPTPHRLKEAAYVGFFYLYISAFVAHVSAGHPLSLVSQPIIALVLVAVSYFYYHKINVVSIATDRD